MNIFITLRRMALVLFVMLGSMVTSEKVYSQTSCGTISPTQPLPVQIQLNAVTGSFTLTGGYLFAQNLCSDCCPVVSGNCVCSDLQAYFYHDSLKTQPVAPDVHRVTFTCDSIGVHAYYVAIRNSNLEASSESPSVKLIITVSDNTAPKINAPDNITVFSNSNGSACVASNISGVSVVAAPVGSNTVANGQYYDNCGGSTVSYTLSGATILGVTVGANPGVETFNVGQTTITYIVMDAHGHSATDIMVVTVKDNTLPAISCPPLANMSTDAMNCYYTYALADASAMDDCPAGLTVTNDVNNTSTLAGHQFAPGSTTITWTATDISGNTETCVQSLSVSDQVDPVFSLADVNTTIFNSCDTVLSITVSNAEIFDACTPDNQLLYSFRKTFPDGSITNGIGRNASGTFPVGTTLIAFRSSDQSGNIGSQTIMVTVADGKTPSLTCPGNQTFKTSCDTAPLPDYRQMAILSDNCPNNLAISQSAAPGTPWYIVSPTPMATITISAFDGQNTSNCSFSVTRSSGNQPVPQYAKLPDVVDSCESAFLAPIAFDISPCVTPFDTIYGTTSSMVAQIIPGTPPRYKFLPGSFQVTWTYDDQNGNVTTQTQNITVIDDQLPPVAKCKNRTVYLNSTGMLTIPADSLNNGSYDPTYCGDLDFKVNSLDNVNFTCSNKGLNNITLAVLDVNGNAATCIAKVTVRDSIAPFLKGVPNDTIIETCTVIPVPATVTGRDTCDGNRVPVLLETTNKTANGCGFYTYTITRRWTVTDASGNSRSDVQIISVQDTQAPVWGTASPSINICTDPNRATCDDTLIVNLKSWVSDCQTDDELAFAYLDPMSMTYLTVPNGQFSRVYPVGNHTVRFRATDLCGNSSFYSVSLTIRDCTAPVATCINSISVTLNAAGTAIINENQINNLSNDNCPGPLSINLDKTMFNCGDVALSPIKVKLTVADGSSNSSFCYANVFVQENSAPVITACPANVTVNCDGSINPTATGRLLPAQVIELCGLDTIYYKDTYLTGPSSCRTLNRRWFAEDFAGNKDNCLQKIFIQDTVKPVFHPTVNHADTVMITCLSQINLNDPLTATDNCESPVVTMVENNTTVTQVCGAYNGRLSINRRWEARDSCGNVATYKQIIILTDSIAPVLTGISASVTVNSVNSVQNGCDVQVTGLDFSNSAADCAGANTLTNEAVVWKNNTLFRTYNSLNANDFYPPGIYTVVYKSMDPCGNTATDTLVLTVKDNSIPTAVCIDNIEVALGSNGSATVAATSIGLQSYDNCGVATFSLAPNTFDCSNLGQNVSTLTITDLSGNTNTCTVNVNVTIGAVAGFTATVANDTVSYFGLNDGALAPVINGGSGTYTYVWSTGATTAALSGLAVGIYSVTITDSGSNCRVVATATVAQGPKMLLKAGVVAGAQGSVVSVPVTVERFNNMISTQFSMHVVDNTVGLVADITNINPLLLAANAADFQYNISSTSVGILWANSLNQAVTIPSGAVLFNIEVNLLGAPATSSPVTIDGTPIEIEINQLLNGTPTVVPIDVMSGLIQVNSGAPMVSVGGTIMTWKNPIPVPNVQVALTGSQTANLTTTVNGQYSFMVNSGDNTTVACSKTVTSNFTNGITGGDLLLIVNHIFGDVLPSPYQWVAADANGDGKISLVDYSRINSVALGTNQHLPGGAPDWKFIPKSYVFPTGNPIATPFPQTISHNPILQDETADDFVAVRMGDVNGNASVTNLVNADDRTNGTLHFRVEDQSFKAGELVTVKFTSAEFMSRQVYQMTIGFDPTVLALEQIEPGILPKLDADNFGTTHLQAGYLTTIWVNNQPITLTEDQTIFTLTFRALQSASSLAKILKVGSEVTQAEAFDVVRGTQQIALDYILPSQMGGGQQAFALLQNQPNPFNHGTVVGFYLPETANATFRIVNATGQVVKSINRMFEKGYNQIEVDQSNIGEAGVYWYELETPTHRDRKKMVLIK